MILCIGGTCVYYIHFLQSNIYTSEDDKCKSGFNTVLSANLIDIGSYYPVSHDLFLFVSLISICSSLSESVCSSISRRVAFSSEIWRAIYRALPEHWAWCCCCCSYLSLLETTPASVSVSLPLYLFPLLFLQLSVFWAHFLLMPSSLGFSQSSVIIFFLLLLALI